MNNNFLIYLFFLSVICFAQKKDSEFYEKNRNLCINWESKYIHPDFETVSIAERKALISFYCSTFNNAREQSKDGWIRFNNWLDPNKPVKEWAGVTVTDYRATTPAHCNGGAVPYAIAQDKTIGTASVTKLVLPNNHINLVYLTNEIIQLPLKQLQYLEELDLSSSIIENNTDTASYFNNLQNFTLTGMTFSNPVKLTSYQRFCSIGYKRIFGIGYREHAAIWRSVSNTVYDNPKFVKKINLSNTNIKGELQEEPFIKNSGELIFLKLDNTNLSNSNNGFSFLMSASKIKELDLSNSKFSGSLNIAEILKNNKNSLELFNISNNKFTNYENSSNSNVFGPGYQNLIYPKLVNFNISNNLFKDKFTLNYHIQNMPVLNNLDISNNKFDGVIIGGFGEDAYNPLGQYNFSNNQFIDVNNAAFFTLTNFDLSQNNLTYSDFFGVEPTVKNRIQKPLIRNAYHYFVLGGSGLSISAVYDVSKVLTANGLGMDFTNNFNYNWYEIKQINGEDVLVPISIFSNPTAENNELVLSGAELGYSSTEMKKNNRKYVCKITSDLPQYKDCVLSSSEIAVTILENTGIIGGEEPVLADEIIDNKAVDLEGNSFNLESNRSYVLSAWIKDEKSSSQSDTYLSSGLIQLKFEGYNDLFVFKPEGMRINGWQRVYGVFTVPNNTKGMSIQLQNNGNRKCFYDDIRIWPQDASMKSFVYDPITHKLMAELDENNYASYYEYDGEGTLVRVKKETNKGVYTIQETRKKSYVNENN